MYNPASIQVVFERIGWAPAVPPTEITVSEDNLLTVSGRFFNGFHQVVTAENIVACIPNKKVTNDVLNDFLMQLRTDTVAEVFNRVFDTNPRANYQFTPKEYSVNYALDYSDVIIAKSRAFDEALGLVMARRVMQLLLATSRSNDLERAIGMNYSQLKGETSGFFTEQGVLIAEGMQQKADAEIVTLINMLFPVAEITTDIVPSPGGGGTLEIKPQQPRVTSGKFW